MSVVHDPALCNMFAVVGLLLDADQNILISQRKPGKYMEGYWEFPGGKLEAGETPEQALGRELEEEIGITDVSAELFMQFGYQYPERTVWLDVYKVTDYQGEPYGREYQLLKWVPLSTISDYQVLPAGAPIIEALLATK